MSKPSRDNGHIADKLHYFLRARGLKQIDIVKQMEVESIVSQSTVNNWFQGVHIPDLRAAFRVCEILEISLSDLADPNVSVDSMREQSADLSRAALDYLISRLRIDRVLESLVMSEMIAPPWVSPTIRNNDTGE